MTANYCAACATEPTPRRSPAEYLVTTTGLRDPRVPEYELLCRYHTVFAVQFRLAVPRAFDRIILEPC